MGENYIWVVSDEEAYDSTHVLQILGKAKELAEKKGWHVAVICIGVANQVSFDSLGRFGAEKIYSCSLSTNNTYMRADILKKLIKEEKPSAVFFQSTPNGKYLAAVCSTHFESGLTADCNEINIDEDGEFIFSRAALNDSIIANIKCRNSDIQMCTVKYNVFEVPEFLDSGNTNTNIVVKSYDCSSNINDKVEVIERVMKEFDGEDNNGWQQAKIVFAIGRGVSTAENVRKIENLASKFHAQIIGTRAAVEGKLISKSRQVGQSGASICPNIYVGFGVSGACQHMVGIKNAKVVIAINKDQNAPIFNYADYKIVDDIENILTGLLAG